MSWNACDPHRFRRLSGFQPFRTCAKSPMKACASVRTSMARSISSRRKKPRKFSSRSARTSPWFWMSASKHPRPAKKPKPRSTHNASGPSARANYFLRTCRRNGELASNGNSASCKARRSPTCAAKARSQLLEIDFPGYAVGGLAVGEPHEVTCEMAAEVTALLPQGSPALSDGRRPPRTTRRLRRARHRHDGLRAPHARRAPCLHLHQRRPRAHQERALRRRTSGRSIRTALAPSAAATRALIFVIFSPPEKSPRPSSPPTTMSTFTLT